MIRFMFVLVLLASFVMADEIYLSRDGQDTQIKILQGRDASAMTVECHVRSLEATEVQTPAGTFTHLYLPGWQASNNPGSPELPILSQLVQIPMGGQVSVRLLSSVKMDGETSQYGIAYPLYPNQPSARKDQKEVAFAYNPEAYQQRAGVNPVVAIEEVGMMRDSRLALIHFMPVEYSPVDGKILFHNDIQAEIVVENADVQATMELKGKCASAYMQYTKMLTPEALQYTATNRKEGYLVVAHKMFEGNSALEQFIAYKAQKYDVVVKYVETATYDSVVALIKAEFNNSHPTFLLIVGDHAQIPGKSCGSHYSDLYYASTMVGSATDYMPDMLYGRFSASTAADLEAQIKKTLAYEEKQFANPDYLNKYALVAGWDSGWAVKRGYPQIRYAFQYYFNQSKNYVKPVESGTGADRNVFLTTKSQDSTKQIVALVSSGVGFFNYTAHGSQTDFSDPNFTMADIDSLKNYNMYPLVVGNCCLTGSFQQPTCFGEKWLRVADKGAIGYIGGSNYTYWDEDLWFGVGNCTITSEINAGQAPKKENTTAGMYETGFGEYANNMPFKVACNASVMVAGNLAVQASSSSRKEYYWQVYHLFGDPSLPCYWAHK